MPKMTSQSMTYEDITTPEAPFGYGGREDFIFWESGRVLCDRGP
jgi:hypothetical protein